MKKIILFTLFISIFSIQTPVFADIYSDVANQDNRYKLCLSQLNQTIDQMQNAYIDINGQIHQYTPEEKQIAFDKQHDFLAKDNCRTSKAELDRLKSFLPANTIAPQMPIRIINKTPLTSIEIQNDKGQIELISQLSDGLKVQNILIQDQINALHIQINHMYFALYIILFLFMVEFLCAFLIIKLLNK